MIFPVKRLADLGFAIVATAGTGEVLRRHGIDVRDRAASTTRARATNAVALIAAGEVALVINTPQGSGRGARSDGYEIRSAAVTADIPCITTVPGAAAAVMGIEALIRGDMTVRPLQELHAAAAERGDESTACSSRRSSGRCCSGSAAGTPETAHEWTLRRLAGLGARPPALAAAARAGTRWPRPVDGVRRAVPQPGRAGRRDGQERRGAAGLAGARASASSRSARSPRTPSRATTGRGCSGCRDSEAIINRMGFNNAGAAALAARLAALGAARRCRWASRSASPR